MFLLLFVLLAFPTTVLGGCMIQPDANGHVDIQNSVTTIQQDAFRDCTSLVSVNIPDSITTIEEYAFKGCTSLVKVNIPNSVTILKQRVFQECSSLVNIDIPNSITTIGVGAFSLCTSLVNIKISNNLTTILTGAFASCYSLVNINIPTSVTTIDSHAFQHCHSLVNINIPNSVTTFGSSVFYDTPCGPSISPPVSLFLCQRVGYNHWMQLMYKTENLVDEVSENLNNFVAQVQKNITTVNNSVTALEHGFQDIREVMGTNTLRIKLLDDWKQEMLGEFNGMRDDVVDLQNDITKLESSTDINSIIQDVLDAIPHSKNYTEEINMLQANNTALQKQLDDTTADLKKEIAALKAMIEALQKPCVCEEKHGCRP
eukprot:m.251191 g.251191  ORF g.251191 m.251191 type:complete len:372 (+) comp16146_c0_seq14:119-1234(+)